jgi:hypothetical protein
LRVFFIPASESGRRLVGSLHIIVKVNGDVKKIEVKGDKEKEVTIRYEDVPSK